MFYDWPYPTTILPTPLLWVVFKEMTDLHEIYEKWAKFTSQVNSLGTSDFKHNIPPLLLTFGEFTP